LTPSHAEQVREIEAFAADFLSGVERQSRRLKPVRDDTLRAIADNGPLQEHAEAAIFQAAEYAGVTLRAKDAREWFYKETVRQWGVGDLSGAASGRNVRFNKLKWYLGHLEESRK
jgi:hypothetical protein